MKFIHTSDWHLGHTLHDISREYEHKSFLEWLLDVIGEEKVDALIVSGDIFDSANPSAQAQALWYGFMAEARRRFEKLDVVVIGGNHDSAARLDAPEPLFRAFGVRVVGGFPFDDDGATNWERVIVPLHSDDGSVSAWVAAVPFLRPADLPPVIQLGLDPLVEGVRLAYSAVLDEARRRREKSQAIVVTGHCYMTGGVVSELSERKILGGNQHALPAEIFTDDVAYVALGHLHYPQAVGGMEHVRYPWRLPSGCRRCRLTLPGWNRSSLMKVSVVSTKTPWRWRWLLLIRFKHPAERWGSFPMCRGLQSGSVSG